MTAETRKIPVWLWPFWALWRLLAIILQLTGRLVAAVLGLALVVVGAALVVTVVLSPVGVALIVFGALLIVRAIF